MTGGRAVVSFVLSEVLEEDILRNESDDELQGLAHGTTRSFELSSVQRKKSSSPAVEQPGTAAFSPIWAPINSCISSTLSVSYEKPAKLASFFHFHECREQQRSQQQQF